MQHLCIQAPTGRNERSLNTLEDCIYKDYKNQVTCSKEISPTCLPGRPPRKWVECVKHLLRRACERTREKGYIE